MALKPHKRNERLVVLLVFIGACRYFSSSAEIWLTSISTDDEQQSVDFALAEDRLELHSAQAFLGPPRAQRAQTSRVRSLATDKETDSKVDKETRLIDLKVVPLEGATNISESVPVSNEEQNVSTGSMIGVVILAFGLGVGIGLAALVRQPVVIPPQAIAPATIVQQMQQASFAPAPGGNPAVPAPYQRLYEGGSSGSKPQSAPAVGSEFTLNSAVQQLQNLEEAAVRKIQTTIIADDEFSKAYSKLMEDARTTGAKLQNTVDKVIADTSGRPKLSKEAPSRVAPSIVKKIRDIADILDEAQADIYNETWESLRVLPNVLRAYEPLLAFYDANAFPDILGDESYNAVSAATRGSLEFERNQLSKGVFKMEVAINERKVRAVEEAFAKTSLAYDRYLKAGDLYTGYDPVTSTTVFFRDISDTQLQYTPVALEQPRIRDEILVLQGPDKGKVGRVIWLGREDETDMNSAVKSAVVKLDPNPVLGSTPQSGGIREVKAYPYSWIVQTRSSNQNYVRDLVLATIAAVISCGLTYPLENIKSRVQLNLSPIPDGGFLELFKGVDLNILREAPNAGFLMAGFNLLTRTAVGLPFINGNDPNLKFFLMIPSGVLAMSSGAFVKVPVVDMSKQIQAGLAKDFGEAFENVYVKPSQKAVTKQLGTVLTLTILRGAPFGAFQCLIYEILKDKTPNLLENAGVPISAEPFIWGAVAGFCTGYLTNPPDVILTKMSVQEQSTDDDADFSLPDVLSDIGKATSEIWEEEGPAGFNKGGLENAIYFAPEAMIWFGSYEALKNLSDVMLSQ